MNVIKLLFVAGISLLVLNGCMSTRHVLGKDPIDYDKASGGGRYSILQDHAPSGDIKVDHLADLVPKWEAKSRGGNKSPYEVWGKKYWVMDSAQGYVAKGTASWYGNKFHGHKTSNGEIYDMYDFSAAHKSLPLPTYVKVTNLDNQRSVIVRVNDRGPFHGDRLIDLSYAAAARLDYHKKGLARVRIEAITPAQGEVYPSSKEVVKVPAQASESAPVKALPSISTSSTGSQTAPSELIFSHLQLGAFSAEASADRLKQRLFEVFDTRVNVSINKQGDGLYKVLVGPFDGSDSLSEWQQKLQQEGFGNPVRVALLP
ncbi:septal ring lytic transglycosylase RlpA family protein [Marinomonas sp. M1K-6]|uniref:Endolytic peptidoglycan transglycosylase RlpA n=1 Tax=Marinomonas profundi TaxID=2726122 RepID=A0A847R539_9GAMM|nr:septal ring lytic transglycosylase RlpA family protein [Marinomonas profundi]NLQ16097.1 septal ring lytic transglycosylase RlpA family protein [Marinomonas profundi]UDV03317.1 septal ring lytic transglycosylase RlpA family protein [Marinomonas profundi]